MGFLDWMPVVGDFVDDLFNPVASIFGIDDVSKTNRSNERIADMNIRMQRETNEVNRQNVLDTNKTNQEIARQYNANQVQLQNDMNVFNKEMWDLNNQYNSPVQQLARAERAGINPNVVFGQPVASSPVQQTSIPSQQMARMEAYQERAPYNEMRYQNARNLEKLGDALRGLSKLPFVREELISKKLANDNSKLENEILQYDRDMRAKDLADRKNVENLYNSMSLVQNVNDPNDLITPDEFELLSDADKKNYTITGENGSPLPNLLKAGFRSRAAFEAWKDIRNVPNFLQNIKTDLTQSRLKYLVDSKKIQSDDAINAMVNMDDATYNRLLYSVKQIKQELQFNRETWKARKRIVSAAADKAESDNRFSDETFETRKHILSLSDEEAMNKVDRNALKIARKFFEDGKLTGGEIAKLLLLKASGFVE